MDLSVKKVRIAANPQQKYLFFAITLSRQPENKEIAEISRLSHDYFEKKYGPFMQLDFEEGNEIHFRPSSKSEEFFPNLESAIYECKAFLKAINLAQCSDSIEADASLYPLDERDTSPQLNPQKQDDIANAGIFSCIVPQ